MSTALRAEDPSFLDDLIGQGADATRRAISGRKRYARAVGISPQRASCHRRGDAHSFATRYLTQLATAGSPWPLIASGIVTVLQVMIKTMPDERLWQRLGYLDDREHDCEAAETRATVMVATDPTVEQLQAAARANEVEAEIQLERSAILRELARRKRRQP